MEVTDELKRTTLTQALVGSDKEKLMVTSVSQSVCSVCEEFGKYIRFIVEINDSEQPGVQQLSTGTARNAFSVMITAQRQIQQGDNGVPLTIHVKTNKDRLYNDLIQLMKELGVKWSDPNSYAVPFLKKLSEILWYIDGHHETISERAPKIPSLFSRYVGYTIALRSISTVKEHWKIYVHPKYMLML